MGETVLAERPPALVVSTDRSARRAMVLSVQARKEREGRAAHIQRLARQQTGQAVSDAASFHDQQGI